MDQLPGAGHCRDTSDSLTGNSCILGSFLRACGAILTWGIIAGKRPDHPQVGTFWLKAMQEEITAILRAVKKKHVADKGKGHKEGHLD